MKSRTWPLSAPRTPHLVAAVVASLALGTAGCNAGENTSACADLPTATGPAVFVSSTCGSATGTGSAASPFLTISAGVKAATPGTTVAIGPGSYAESVVVPAGVHLLGAGLGKTSIEPPVVAKGSAPGIAVTGSGKTAVEGLTVKGATGTGIQANGAELVVTAVQVTATKAADNVAGHGIQLVGGAGLTCTSCVITDNVGVGVLAAQVGTVAIIDPTFKPNARGTTETGIIDPTFAPASQVSNNKGGGISIIDPTFAPAKTDDLAAEAVRIVATDVSGNTGFGIAVYGGGLSVERSAIRNTIRKQQGLHDFADGIVLGKSERTAKAQVRIDVGSFIGGNERAGLLAAQPSDVQVEGEIAGNGMGGVWAQGKETLVRLRPSACLAKNALVGVAAIGGATLDIDGSRIEGTTMRKFGPPGGGMPIEVGDGVGIFGKARATIKNARIAENFRAGLLLNDAAATATNEVDVEVTGTNFIGGNFGVVVNKGGAAAAPAKKLKDGNTFDKVATPFDPAGSLGIQGNVCGSDKDPCEFKSK